MLLRIFLLPGVTFKYLEKEFVKIRLGGVSTSGIKSNYTLNREILVSCRANGVQASWLSVLPKYPKKLMGYVVK